MNYKLDVDDFNAEYKLGDLVIYNSEFKPMTRY